MPRFQTNRWWTFILTVGVLATAWLAHPSSSVADVLRDQGFETVGGTGFGGGPAPPPTGVGDPDVPVATSLKRMQRGSIGGGDATLTMRAVGDGRYVGVRNVWMWRLSVVARALRAYWLR